MFAFFVKLYEAIYSVNLLKARDFIILVGSYRFSIASVSLQAFGMLISLLALLSFCMVFSSWFGMFALSFLLRACTHSRYRFSIASGRFGFCQANLALSWDLSLLYRFWPLVQGIASVCGAIASIASGVSTVVFASIVPIASQCLFAVLALSFLYRFLFSWCCRAKGRQVER